MKSDLIDLTVVVKHTTDRAVLVDDGTRRAWLPLSQVEVAPNDDGRTHTVTCPEWLATDKGLV